MFVVIAAGCSTKSSAPAPTSESLAKAQPASGPRDLRALLDDVTVFATRIQTPPMPRLGDAAFARLPTETDLVALHVPAPPWQERIELALAIHEQTNRLGVAYSATDVATCGQRATCESPESVQLMIVTTRLFGHIARLTLDEANPAAAEKDPASVGLDQTTDMGRGAVEMMTGMTLTVGNETLGVAQRRELASAWRMHLPTAIRMWQRRDCEDIRARLAVALETAKDADVRRLLGEMRGLVTTCTGPRSP